MLTPERPFIPESSLSRPARETASAPFRLTRPFIHGLSGQQGSLASSAQSDRNLLTEAESFVPATDDNVPPISVFLETPSSSAQSVVLPEERRDTSWDFDSTPTVRQEASVDFISAYATEDLPPVEHFTDPLPAIEDFGTAETYERAVNHEPGGSAGIVNSGYDAQVEIPVDVVSDLQNESAWVDTGWQQFDWTGAAALGEDNDPVANSEWSQTDWDAAPPAERKETAAQAIANALDQIAQRIRNGELLVPPADIVNDSAAIAATLAAMLGVRR